MARFISGFLVSGALAFTAGIVPVNEAPSALSTPSRADVFVTATTDPGVTIKRQFKTAPEWTWSSCVEFAKWATGNEGRRYGDAAEIKPNETAPYAGHWALMDEGPGHVVAIALVGSSSFETMESNYLGPEPSSRSIPFGDPRIRGYFDPGVVR